MAHPEQLDAPCAVGSGPLQDPDSCADDPVIDRVKARLRQLNGDLRKAAMDIYTDHSTSKDIALGSIKAMILEAQIEELEWVLSQMK